MEELGSISTLILYVLLAFIGLYGLILWVWQFMVLRGRAFQNPDGSTDDWHRERSFYGFAFADVTVSCPATLAGVVLIFVAPRWGHYLLALASFWWVWANVMTTATSMRFYDWRKRVVYWFFTFPFGALLGLAYIVWTIVHFEIIYGVL